MEEMVNDELDSALDNEDMEEEIEEEVDKVLEELAVETTAQLPASAAPRVRVKPSAESAQQVTHCTTHNLSFFFLGTGLKFFIFWR
jgi:charged multivesicular body protein 3